MTRAADLVAQLAERALAVCHHYLPNGRRVGNYWVVGDALNTPGRSMYVRLFRDNGGAAGRWTDAATGEYGDLLDILRLAVPSGRFSDALIEAEWFAGRTEFARRHRFRADRPRRSNHTRLAGAIYGEATSIEGTLAESYLRCRDIDPALAPGLRYMSHCYCRPCTESNRTDWPAIIAPVTDHHDRLTGIHRLYLDPAGAWDFRLGKAPIDRPKRSLGPVQGSAVRFGDSAQVIVVAEGIENALSIRTAMPGLTCHAALTAGNLASYSPPPIVNRLLIAVDNDDAGRRAAQTLAERSRIDGLAVTLLTARNEDHNHDLRTLGLAAYRASLLDRLMA